MSRQIKILYLLIGAAAAIGLVSAIGSTCTTFDSRWWITPNNKGGFSFGIIGDLITVFLITYFVTWLATILWGVLFWALQRRKTWFYKVAIVTSVAGFLSGLIPALILLYEWYMSYGVNGMVFTPSWFRTLINAILLIVLLLPMVKNGISTHIKDKSVSLSGDIGSGVAQFAFVLFGFGIVMIVQPLIMPTHIMNGVNIASSFGDLIASGMLQLIGGLFCIFLGLFLRVIGKFLTIFYDAEPRPINI